MSYEQAVRDLIELPEVKSSGWLAVVDEVRTVSVAQLRQLASDSPLTAPSIVFPRRPKVFDVAASKSYFSNSEWVPVKVTVSELRAIMPGGVVSDRAWRVGLSPAIADLFKEGMVARLAIVEVDCEKICLALADEKHLATIALERKLHVCHCAEFASKGFCKHILLGVFHFHEAILDRWGKLLDQVPRSPSAAEWMESFRLAQQHMHRRIMLCNWLYYFIKDCYATLQFKAGKYRFQNAVKKAIKQMEVKA